MKNKDQKPEKHPIGYEPGGTEPNGTRLGGALLGIRDSETGEYLKYDDGLPVTLRVEPPEPCLWCGDTMFGQVYRLIPYETLPGVTEYEPDTLYSQNWTYCPSCGRRLTYD